MVYTHQTIFQLRKIFCDLCKIIYVDLDYTRIIQDEKNNDIVIPNTPFIVDLTFYLIMSQYFKKAKIKFAGELTDLRISVFMIRSSRIGKGQLIKVIESLGKNLGLRIKRISYLNQASLIGTLNKYAMEFNYKKNLKPGMLDYKEPVIYGVLAKYDILIFPEAKKLLKGANEADTEFILSTLQEALDYPGFIDKTMKESDLPIQYESTVSIFSTTYYVTEIADLLLDQGFFQRNIIDKRNFTVDEIKELRRRIIEKYRQISNKVDFNKKSEDIGKIIKDDFKNDEKLLEFTDEAIRELHKFNEQFFSQIKDISGKELEILKSFSQTAIHLVTKIAGVNCCIRQDDKIIIEDLIPAIEMFHPYVKILTTQLFVQEKKGSEIENYKRLILQIYKDYMKEKKTLPGKYELIDFCKPHGFNHLKASKLISLMCEENYFIIEKPKEGNKHLLKLVE